MALTMTRTRTQTTLTKLARLTAETNGELAFVERLLAEMPEHNEVLEARRLVLLSARDALYATIRQFDATIDPETIGSSEVWRKKVLPRVQDRRMAERYLTLLAQLLPR